MYIYSKCAKMHKNEVLSYGYPMGMLWVSYGAGRYLAGKWQVNGRKMQKNDVCICVCR